MKLSIFIATLLLLGASGAALGAEAPLGTRPTYLDRVADSVPNVAALSNRIWTPALDEGYVPQGLTAAGPHLLVSSYLPTPDLKANTGPCRVFRIEAATGKAAGHFDLPVGACTHSGGMAYLGNGRRFL